MKLASIERKTSWVDVLNAARVTRGSAITTEEPTSEWKTAMLRAEHSPIRELIFTWEWVDLPYYSSVHFVRHHIGINHYVLSQRPDREHAMGPQDAPVRHRCTANAQAIINISIDRLCGKTDVLTRSAWDMVVFGIMTIGEEELFKACKPKCLHIGRCTEINGCGRMPQ